MSVKTNEAPRTNDALIEENKGLRARLDEAEQTLDAIRNGDVDALVVAGPHGDQIFSLTGAERTYRLIVETMNEAALTVAFDGTILFCNHRFCDLVKASMADTIGQNLTTFVQPLQEQPLRMLLADAQTRPVQVRFMLRATDSTAVPVQLAASLLVSDTQTSICMVAADLAEVEAQAVSITDLRNQQRALEESRAELKTANTFLLDSRRAALNMMEDADMARKRAEEISADLLCEVIERKRAEKALRQSEQRLDLLAETASSLLASDSPQEVVDSLCQKVMAFLDCHVFFNFLVDEGAGRLHLNACAGIPEEEKRRIEWLDYGVAVCGCAARDACRIVAEDIPGTPDPRTELVKSYGILAYACHPLIAHGRVLGTLSFGTRTRSGFSDDDLALMKAVAGQVAIAMERKRYEEELRSAKDAADRANSAKSLFLANMSHELRTPMTGVLGMLDLALGNTLDDTQKEYLGIAHNSAHSLLRIINDILDLTKIEAGKLVISEDPFAFREWLASAVEIFLPEANRKGLELAYSTTGDLPQIVVGDQLRLRQVLTNLIGNAVKFTERGKVEVRVAAGGKTADGRREFTFTIADTGIGIPGDKRHLLFRSFSQADDSHTRTYGGTGLGLAISKEIVELMGGQIDFESTENAGSLFSFTVPLGDTETGTATDCLPPAQAQEESIAPCRAEDGKQRILIAEDDPINRKILEQVFRLQNYEPDFATTGIEAVEMWEKGAYELIVMDVQMPQMDGFEATKTIRERERSHGCHPIILAMTAHAFREDEQRCLDAGMDAYISKPIDFNKCFELLASFTTKNTSLT